jgi:hypothetical protein
MTQAGREHIPSEWLRAHVQPGRILRLDKQVADVHGRSVRLRPGLDAVNGGPLLVRDGHPFIDAFTEWWPTVSSSAALRHHRRTPRRRRPRPPTLGFDEPSLP